MSDEAPTPLPLRVRLDVDLLDLDEAGLRLRAVTPDKLVELVDLGLDEPGTRTGLVAFAAELVDVGLDLLAVLLERRDGAELGARELDELLVADLVEQRARLADQRRQLSNARRRELLRAGRGGTSIH